MNLKLINFENETEALKTKIYRYISYDVFKTIVQHQHLKMSRISSWEDHDPFENVLFKFPLVRGKEKVALNQLPKHYFAQCWTLTKESDLMWQLYRQRYSNYGGVVKLESTIGRLLQSTSSLDFSYIGKVRYLPKGKLIAHSRMIRDTFESSIINDGGRGRAIAEMLLIKRYPYHQEKEVRLIVRVEKESRYENFFDHNTEFESYVNRIVFDPKFKDKDFRNKKNEISKINSSLRIILSKLYKIENADFVYE